MQTLGKKHSVGIGNVRQRQVCLATSPDCRAHHIPPALLQGLPGMRGMVQRCGHLPGANTLLLHCRPLL